MTTYKVDVEGENVLVIGPDETVRIHISDFRLNNGREQAKIPTFTSDQKYFNFLDCIKDAGSGGVTLTAGDMADKMNHLQVWGREVWNPPFQPSIKQIRSNFIDAYDSWITSTAWTVVKKHRTLNPKIVDYNWWSYDAGIGGESFLAPTTQLANNLGTSIDTAGKKYGGENWPNVGKTVELPAPFMNLMGFGNSTIKYTTIDNKDMANGFTYTIDIKCGKYCKGGGCEITKQNAAEYFVGNTQKNRFLDEMPGEAEKKTKKIVAKELGDKLQVLLHFLRVKYEGGLTGTLCTGDYPVFVLCLNLQIPCIHTGEKGSILHYKPGTKEEIIEARLKHIRNSIFNHNKYYIDAFKAIEDDRDETTIWISGSACRLERWFYACARQDLTALNAELMATYPFPEDDEEGGEGEGKEGKEGDGDGEMPWWLAAQADVIERDMKRTYAFIPFIGNSITKSKIWRAIGGFAARARGEGLLDNKLRMLSTKNYTKTPSRTFRENGGRPAFTEHASKLRNVPFKNIAWFHARILGGGGRSKKTQTGGYIPDDILALFQGDADEAVLYRISGDDGPAEIPELGAIGGDAALLALGGPVQPAAGVYNLLYILDYNFTVVMKTMIKNEEANKAWNFSDEEKEEILEDIYTKLNFYFYINNKVELPTEVLINELGESVNLDLSALVKLKPEEEDGGGDGAGGDARPPNKRQRIVGPEGSHFAAPNSPPAVIRTGRRGGGDASKKIRHKHKKSHKSRKKRHKPRKKPRKPRKKRPKRKKRRKSRKKRRKRRKTRRRKKSKKIRRSHKKKRKIRRTR